MKQFIRQGIIVLVAGLAIAFAATVEELLNQMNPMLGDGAARTELRKMSRDVMVPPVDASARSDHETALINGLDLNLDDAIKADAIRELQIVGTGTCVARLGEIIATSNETLYEPATQALMAIYQTTHDPNIWAVVRTAMASATGDRLGTLIKAAGSIRDRDPATQQLLLANAVENDWSLRGAALRSLAQIGDLGARDALANALTTAGDSYELARIITWNLSYARRLAERNLKADGTEVANDINTYAQNNTLGGCQGSVHVLMCADATLSEIPDIPVSVKRKIGKASGEAPAIQIESGFKINILAEGAYEISLMDIMGKTLWSQKGSEPGAYTIPKSLVSAGVYAIQVKSGRKIVKRHVVFH